MRAWSSEEQDPLLQRAGVSDATDEGSERLVA